jgi:hypothetical protein
MNCEKYSGVFILLLCSCATSITTAPSELSVKAVAQPVTEESNNPTAEEIELRARITQVTCGFSRAGIRALLGEPDRVVLVGLTEYYYGPITITLIGERVVAVNDQTQVLMICGE